MSEGEEKELAGQEEECEEKEEKKSEDKLQIEEEEREKMIEEKKESEEKIEEEEKKEEKRVKGAEVEKKKKALEEAAMEGTKRRVPIGGIKIPGFLRPKSREKPKEGEGETEEATDLLEPSRPSEQPKPPPDQPPPSRLQRLRLHRIRLTNPFAKFTKEGRNGGDEEDKPSGARLLNAVKLPLASVLPKLRPTHTKEVDPEAPATTCQPSDDPDSRIDENNMDNIKLESQIDAEKAALEEEAESRWAARDWRFYTDRFYEFRYPIICLIVLFTLLLIVIILAVCGGQEPIHAPIIDGKFITAVTSCGFVEGIASKGMFVFRGVPYAVAPVNNLRWSPPRPFELADCWNGTLKVHNSTESCFRLNSQGIPFGTEDCLHLDIHTPHVRYDSPLPVVVILGVQSLDGLSSDLEPAAGLARKKDVVFVRPNFRLSSLGFLAAKPLSDSRYPHSSGNYGLHDIVAALKWIRLNIVHFGGDNASVTVLAHRGAATLVSALTSALKVEKLFDRVWLSSPASVFPNRSLLESERQSENYLQSLDCGQKPTAECLRRLDATDVIRSVPKNWIRKYWDLPLENEDQQHGWLVQDGLIIRQHPFHVWTSGNVSVQVVLGSTRHSEWNNETFERQLNWSEEAIIGHLKASVLGNQGLVDEVLRRYNSTLPGLQHAIADIRTVCPLFSLHKLITNSRFYLVTQPRMNGMADGSLDIEAILGVYTGKTSEERHYVNTIQSLFYRYASNGVLPNHRMFYLAQEASPFKELPNCDFWGAYNFTTFARVD